MIRCTEKTERWPNALVDVSPDELDEFLDHAESCQYHAAMMRAEEEECHSVFRSARGFNSHGRVLEGTELESAIREYRRQQAVWQNSARQMEVPFKHISISNCGEEIASCGKFFAFRKHEGIHELEPEAGLQIWGVIGERGTEKILLGFYSLVHVQHKGEESLLPLENGYTVGILVEQKSERSFKIEFRCVENEVLQDELARLKPQSKRQSKVAKAANVGKSFRISVIDGIKSVFRPLTPLTQTYTGLAVKSLATFLIVFGCVSVAVLIFDRHGSPPSIEAENPDDPKTVNVGRRDPGLETNGRRTEARRRSTVKPLNIKRQLSLSKQRAEVRTVGKKAFMPANELSKISNGEPIQAAAELVSEPSFPSAAALRSQIQWRFQALLGTEGGQPGAFVVNRGNDDMLKKKLLAEFEGRSIFLAPNMHSSAVVPMRQEFTISWSVVRAESFATVEAVVTLGGQSKTLTFKSAGSCAEHACENAVRDAVSGVLAVMEGQLSADGKGELATGF